LLCSHVARERRVDGGIEEEVGAERAPERELTLGARVRGLLGHGRQNDAEARRSEDGVASIGPTSMGSPETRTRPRTAWRTARCPSGLSMDVEGDLRKPRDLQPQARCVHSISAVRGGEREAVESELPAPQTVVEPLEGRFPPEEPAERRGEGSACTFLDRSAVGEDEEESESGRSPEDTRFVRRPSFTLSASQTRAETSYCSKAS
jgi:hypothetical protein